MRTLKKTLPLLLCLLFLAAPLFILSFPYEPRSMQEQDSLSPMPEFSVEGVVNGSYFAEISGYLSDHIPGRSFWLKLQTKVTLALQKKEINNVYVLSDRLIQRTPEPRAGVVEAAVASVKNFAESFSGKTFLMLVPTAEEVNAALLPGVQAFSQKQLIDSTYNTLSSYGVAGVDAYTALASAADRYLYCRTDSRWTSLGAYYGYSAIARTMGFTPVSADRMNIEHVSHDFFGGLFWETGVTGITPDTIDIYTYSGYTPGIRLTLYDGLGRESYKSLYFREYLATEDGYSVFLGEDVPMAVIETDYQTGEDLLIFGDGLCDNLIPFLSLHYSRITLVDLSVTGFNYKDHLDPDDYDSVLFCYGVDSLVQGGQIGRANLPASTDMEVYNKGMDVE